MKFDYKTILESLNKELNLDEILEVKKALLAYDLGLENPTQEQEERLNKTINFYLNSDDNFVDFEIINYYDILERYGDEEEEEEEE